MGLIREPKDVDFYIQSKPLTEKDHAEILEFIKKSKAANLGGEKRKARKKSNIPLDVDNIQSTPMTEEERRELSEIIKKGKAVYLTSLKRKTKRQVRSKV